MFNRSNHNPGIDMSGVNALEAVVYTNGRFNLGASAELGGSIFADYGTLSGSGNFMVTNVAPNGSPGSATTTSWSVAPGTWHECPSGVGCT